jgi:hypothetical protein
MLCNMEHMNLKEHHDLSRYRFDSCTSSSQNQGFFYVKLETTKRKMSKNSERTDY